MPNFSQLNFALPSSLCIHLTLHFFVPIPVLPLHLSPKLICSVKLSTLALEEWVALILFAHVSIRCILLIPVYISGLWLWSRRLWSPPRQSRSPNYKNERTQSSICATENAQKNLCWINKRMGRCKKTYWQLKEQGETKIYNAWMCL